MTRSLLAPLAALALAGCFLQPGASESALTLNRDGTFDFRYSGEIVAMKTDTLDGLGGGGSRGEADVDFDAATATCSGEEGERYVSVASPDSDDLVMVEPAMVTDSMDGADATPQPPCTAGEIAGERDQRRALNARRAAERQQQTAMLARLGGLGDGSDEAYREVARRLNEQRGWSDVVYRGDGVFTGSYRIAGRVDAGFVFPLLPTTPTVTPFVRLVPLTDGRVRVDAPGLTNASGTGAMAAYLTVKSPSDPFVGSGPQPHGTFTLTTDGDVLTNNTHDGAATEGRLKRLSWTIGGLDQVVPVALLRL